jgi:hypothetical protein
LRACNDSKQSISEPSLPGFFCKARDNVAAHRARAAAALQYSLLPTRRRPLAQQAQKNLIL